MLREAFSAFRVRMEEVILAACGRGYVLGRGSGRLSFPLIRRADWYGDVGAVQCQEEPKPRRRRRPF
jgi:hypothetical protein